ncbi:Dipeptidyl-aminopeptidase B [Smittium culicis]|uniref:Dipeptidyl-aminopeptidase B n=1 Tax=Smittium culicis TaxID=133412 RepID=A0A1R1XF06_9FUNG|nr:Dipeptidyl-aminopeptidase B [Smittium culicis]
MDSNIRISENESSHNNYPENNQSFPFIHSLDIDSTKPSTEIELDSRNDFRDSYDNSLYLPEETFETDDQRMFYSQFSDTNTNRYKNLYINWKRKNSGFKKIFISIIALLGLYLIFINTNSTDKKESSKTANSDVIDKVNDSSKIIDSSGDQMSQFTSKNVIKFSDLISGAYSPSRSSFKFISHPNDTSIDGLHVEGSFDFKISSLEGTFQHVLATTADMLGAIENAGLDTKTTFISSKISQDWKFILLEIKRTKVFRHSYFSTYYIYSVNNKTLQPLSNTMNDKVMDAQFSPKGHSISFIIENDLYTTNMVSQNRITTNGSENVFNGISDWVYEEEVLSSSKAHWWSPDSSKIIFLQTNDTLVPEFKYSIYNSNNQNNSYPEGQSIKYPKAGFPNPTAKLFVFDLNSPESSSVSLDITEPDSIVTGVSWITNGDSSAIIKISNRIQNHFKVFLISKSQENRYNSKLVREISSVNTDKAWIDITSSIIYIPADSSRSISEGYMDIVESKGFNHIGLFSPIDSSEPRLLTEGEWDVIDGSIYYDHSIHNVYYKSTTRSSYSKEIFSLSLESKITKNLTSELILPSNVTGIGSYDASVSHEGKYAIIRYIGPQIPWDAVYKLKSGLTAGKPVFVISDNSRLRESVKNLALPTIEMLSIPGQAGYADMDVKLLLPPGFNSSLKKHYSVLFNVYGGPNSKMVDESYFLNNWNAAAVSASASKSEFQNAVPLIVVYLDPRGTAFKGRKFSRIVSGELGTIEAKDVARGAEYLLSKFEYMDPARVGIWGWSYGGFLTLKVLETAPKLFKLGMSVAPVTDWKFYDSVYTERYMNLPENNIEGYGKSAVHDYDNIASTNLLLMHGTGDDNVHIQNSYIFVDKMIQVSNHNMTVMVYPDSDHSIVANGARPFLNNMLSTYLFSKFSK